MSVYVEVRTENAPSPWGPVIQLQIGRHDDTPMAWREVWEAFAERYPGRWAVQIFPPAEHLVDEVQAYHLWVWPEGEEPSGLRIDRAGYKEGLEP